MMVILLIFIKNLQNQKNQSKKKKSLTLKNAIMHLMEGKHLMHLMTGNKSKY